MHRHSIRLAGAADLPAVLEIANWATRHTASSMKTEPDALDDWTGLWQATAERYPWFVAERDGVVVGFAMAGPFQSRCGYAYSAEVTTYVARDWWNQGIGSALYGHLIPTLRAQGFATLIAAITVPNPASERLHARFGFRRVGVLAQSGWKFNRWHDIAYWQAMIRANAEPPASLKAVGTVRVEQTPR